MKERTYVSTVAETVGKEGYVWRRSEIVMNARTFLQQGGMEARREVVRTTIELHRLLNGVQP